MGHKVLGELEPSALHDGRLVAAQIEASKRRQRLLGVLLRRRGPLQQGAHVVLLLAHPVPTTNSNSRRSSARGRER